MQREDWDRRYSSVENLWAVKPNRFLVAEAGDLPPGRALDLACGEGQNAIWLATLGWDVAGVDFSEAAIAKARARAERDGVNIELTCADLLEYEAAAGAFDLVSAPLPPRTGERAQASARESRRRTRSRGDPRSRRSRPHEHDRRRRRAERSALLYTPDQIASELAGLEIEKAERVRRDVNGEERDAIDVLVRARRPLRS